MLAFLPTCTVRAELLSFSFSVRDCLRPFSDVKINDMYDLFAHVITRGGHEKRTHEVLKSTSKW